MFPKPFRFVFVVAALLVVALGSQYALLRMRPVGANPLAESAFAVFGGFRSLASEIVWFRADRLYDEGRYVELAQLARALTLSEPHTPEVWSYASWNLAYNVSVMMPTPADRWRWVHEAIRLLRDDGLALNPRSAELHRELAMLFEIKLGLDVDDAAGFYRARWREMVEDVARRDAWQELSMKPELIAETERETGLVDRADPLFSTAYWSLRGLAVARPREALVFREMIRQAVLISRRRAESSSRN